MQPARKTDAWPDGSRRLDAEHAGELVRAVDEELRRGHHAIALGAVAAAGSPAHRAGEMLAACGTAFHRRPQPFSAVDCLSAAADLVPEIAVGESVWTMVSTVLLRIARPMALQQRSPG